MRRSKELQETRAKFIITYIHKNIGEKQMKNIVSDLVEILFITDRTIYNILKKAKSYNLNFMTSEEYSSILNKVNYAINLINQEKQ